MRCVDVMNANVEKFGWRLVAPFLLLGLAGLVAGFLYGVLFAGIPYPDPTPELAARYALHSWIYQGICCAGAVVEFSGLAMAAVLLALRVLRRRGAGMR